MKLPILVSVPHAGLLIPPEAQPFCILTPEQIAKDGDEGAAEIYALRNDVETFVTSDVARAIIDLNRAEDDRRIDGVVKTHTIWNEPIFNTDLPGSLIESLIRRYHRPYHEQLDRVDDEQIRLCVDCHTMAAVGPPIGPDTGEPRPHVCLGDVNGTSLPDGWMSALEESFRECFGDSVTRNKPFCGGYITRRHSASRPWVQIELSRSNFASRHHKREMVLNSLRGFCRRVFGVLT